MTINYQDNEALTDNFDDDVGQRVFHFLETIEKTEPDRLKFWIHIVKLWNDMSKNELALTLFEKFLTILEKRYVQVQKEN